MESYNSNFSYYSVATTTASIVLSSTTSVLSMIGSFFIILTYFTWKEIRISSRRILVYISIADFLTAFGNMFYVVRIHENLSLCKFQSFVTTTSSLWSFFWSTFMAVYLYLTIGAKKPILAEKALCVFHLFAWGIPLAITGTALRFQALGYDNDVSTAGWCWIAAMANHKKKLMWMFVTGKGWEIMTYILILGFYFALKYHIQTELYYLHDQFLTDGARHRAIKADKKLTFVPIVFLICRIWGTTRFLLAITKYQYRYDWLVYLQGIGDSAQGFANFLLFCFFTEKFQNRARQICCYFSKSSRSSVQEHPNPNCYNDEDEASSTSIKDHHYIYNSYNK